MTEKLTQFDYLLNAMHHAGRAENPAQAGYGDKRRALILHVRALEKDAACWRALCKRMDERMTPVRSEWRIVEISPMYGADESGMSNWREQIEAAVRAVGAA